MVNFTPSGFVADAVYGLGLLSSFGQQVDVVGIYANGANNIGSPTGGPSSTILNSITGTTEGNAAFGQLFVNARPLKATVRETSRVMNHPVESGVILSDHHIINEVEIELPLIVTAQFYAATFSQIRQAFINATPLSVKTRVGVYSNMIIADMPHEEDAEMYDAITLALRLRQVIYILPGSNQTAQNFQPADPLNSNTVASGLQQAAALGTRLLTSAGSVASYVNLAGKGFL